MANKKPDFDVCVPARPKPDGNGHFYTNVGAAWCNGEVINIRLDLRVCVDEITLFPIKEKSQKDGQQ